MRLKRSIAELLYLRDNRSPNILPFDKQGSNIQDSYCKAALREIPSLLSGYISNRGWLGHLIRGCIIDFINTHGQVLNKQNYDSLAKRIVSRVKAGIDEVTRED